MKIQFLSDVHGHWQPVYDSVNEVNYPTIQLGDLGIGFLYRAKKPDPETFGNDFHFIRGNHDNPKECRKRKDYLGDYGIFKNKIGYISGAWSIDADLRIPGRDWWADEELSYKELEKAIDLMVKAKPKVIISHATPNVFKSELVRMPFPSRTEQALQEIFNQYKPEYWICGHYHTSLEMEIDGTKFICLDVGKTLTLDI